MGPIMVLSKSKYPNLFNFNADNLSWQNGKWIADCWGGKSIGALRYIIRTAFAYSSSSLFAK